LIVDGISSGQQNFSGIFIDSSDYTKIIGCENRKDSTILVWDEFYTGFIWEVCIFQTYKTTWDDDIKDTPCPDTNCIVCPEDQCLIDCEITEFYENDECSPCREDCTDGCLNEINCNKCFDP